MAIDTRRVVEAALEAAVKEAITPKPKKKRRLTARRALLLGAGLATAGRIAAGPTARKMYGRVQQRITDADWFGEEPPDDVVEYDEEPEDEEEYEDEPDEEEYEDEPDEEAEFEDEPDEEEYADEPDEEEEFEDEEGDEFAEEDEADEEGLESKRAD